MCDDEAPGTPMLPVPHDQYVLPHYPRLSPDSDEESILEEYLMTEGELYQKWSRKYATPLDWVYLVFGAIEAFFGYQNLSLCVGYFSFYFYFKPTERFSSAVYFLLLNGTLWWCCRTYGIGVMGTLPYGNLFHPLFTLLFLGIAIFSPLPPEMQRNFKLRHRPPNDVTRLELPPKEETQKIQRKTSVPRTKDRPKDPALKKIE